MMEQVNVNKLGEYSPYICNEIKKSIGNNISDLTKMLTMLDDMQRIMDEFVHITNEQQKEIEDLKVQLEKNTALLSDREREIDRLRKKEEEYSKLEIDAVQMADMLKDVEEKKKLLEDNRERLQSDRDRFELEKASIINDRDIAVNKMREAKDERNQAINSRDKAISEKEKIQLEKDELDKKIKEYESELGEYYDRCASYETENKKIKDCAEWYKKYASALNQKIMDYFEKKDENGLRNHFFQYLNDDNKLEEIRAHFPDFKNQAPTDASEEVNDSKASQRKESEEEIGRLGTERTVEAVPKVSTQNSKGVYY